MTYRLNLSVNKPYHTQINNKYYPHTTCNTTSAIMGLLSSNIDFDYPKDEQPEDYLTMMLESEEAYREMKKRVPWAWTKEETPMYPPRQVHIMLEWGINKITGFRADRFKTTWSIQQMIFNLLEGGAVLVNGKFYKYDHIVCLVGFETSQENIKTVKNPSDILLNKINHFIVDDPYGDYKSGYKSVNGNDIKISYQGFNDMIYTAGDPNRKWGHLLSGGGK